ncbi:MAG: ABC transporter permease [Planctomycetota bacterium]|jgi:hypothetical protein
MRSIWAVATNTIKQALRMKVAAVFIILLIVLLPVMGSVMTGDGTLKGRLQSFVSYGLSLTSLLMCLLTIVVSTYSLTSDLEQKQIYTVLTKPVRRFQLLIGKLLGVILLDLALLVLFSALIYTVSVYIPRFSEASETERIQAQNEFYTARASLVPLDVDVKKEVSEVYDRLKKAGRLPEGHLRDQVIKSLTKQKKIEKRAVSPGYEVVWQFNDVKPLDPNQSLFIRYKYDVSVNPPDLQIYGKWLIGDFRQYGVNIETPVYRRERKDVIRTFYEIEVPTDAVAKDGHLAVAFFNDSQLNNTVVIFPPKDGLEVLYKADTFTANFIKAVCLILFRLIFLSCLGILASSFLSFPVAILFCLAIFLTGTINGFILESFDAMSANISGVYRYTLKPVIQLLPQFDKFNPGKFLVPARLLEWLFLAKVAGLMVGIKAFLLLVVALIIFSYREIAKITV